MPARLIQRSLGVITATLGLTAFVAAKARADDIVRLPPYIVEQKFAGPHWRYAKMPGFEVLSLCSDGKARALAYSYYRAHLLDDALLPPGLLGRFDVPTKLIFYGRNLWPAALEESAAAVLRSSPFVRDLPPPDRAGAPTPFDELRAPNPLLSRRVFGPPPQEISSTASSAKPVFFEDMRLSDDDAIVIFTVAPADNTGYYRTFLKPTYVAQLLSARTPSLPSWFVAGFLDLYERLEFAEDTVRLGPFVWLDAEQTEAAKRDPGPVVRTWLPLVDLLDENATALSRRSVGTSRIARAQLRLFIRWALDPAGGSRREAFGRLVGRNSHEPVSEQLVQATFGIPSSELTKQLAGYLHTALRHPVVWRAPGIDYPEMNFSDATTADSARIRGDWERLQAAYVQQAAPEYVSKYRAKAHYTLEHAYDRGERDPRLLAVFGLSELEEGDAAMARDLLARAVKAGDARPKADLELARLKFAEDLAQGGGDGKLSRGQADAVLKLLAAAGAHSPQMLGTYELALKVWENAAVIPRPADLAFLARGTTEFPRSAELACRTARIYLTVRRPDEAFALVERAVRLGASDAYLQPLQDLRSQLARDRAR